ncbi:MAG: site-specific DNA-methyltransferase [Phycisphaerales bacterium]|nr:site-specific DNA-methyltransferase [Phycisphaerales bacterium]
MPARPATTSTPTSTLHTTDWLTLAPTLPRYSIDFLYADPPFNTGKSHSTPPNATKAGRSAQASYFDSWPTTADYISWLRARLLAIIPALKPTASIAIHCDHRASHHIRLLLDELLTPDHFINHLIWHYGLGGSSPRRFARKHDDILIYGIDPAKYYFKAPMVPATSQRLKGKLKKATDVLDIPAINNMARERTGYPTQKPIELLELLISAFCPPGGTVLDPCCGSGTTLLAAANLGRAGIGCDISPAAIGIATKRVPKS